MGHIEALPIWIGQGKGVSADEANNKRRLKAWSSLLILFLWRVLLPLHYILNLKHVFDFKHIFCVLSAVGSYFVFCAQSFCSLQLDFVLLH